MRISLRLLILIALCLPPWLVPAYSGLTVGPGVTLGTGTGNAAPGTVSPHAVGGAIFTGTLDASLNLLQSGSTSVSGTLAAPANGIAGRQLELWLTVSGTVDRTLALPAAIKLPSDSALSLPKTLTAGKLYILKLWHNGTNWMLVSLVGGF